MYISASYEQGQTLSKEKEYSFIKMAKSLKAILYKDKDKAWDMNSIQIDHPTWGTSKIAKDKEKDASNGTMGKSMMENGKAEKNMEVEYGKTKMGCLMSVNGGEISLKVSGF